MQNQRVEKRRKVKSNYLLYSLETYYLVIINCINNMSKNIAIFNSFPFHYEMYGYIIYYCFYNKYDLTIYTEDKHDMGWFIFYNSLFNNYGNKYNFDFIHYTCFEKSLQNNNYDLIFLTTDDDPNFEVRWMTERVICINHYYICRRVDWFHCIGTRPFCENLINWAIPCIPVFDTYTKITNIDNEFMHIAIIGGGVKNKTSYDTNIINRLVCSKKIKIHIFSRVVKCEFNDINDNIEIKKYEYSTAQDMYSILLRCSYILTDIDNVMNTHRSGHTMSGSVPIAFSSLSKLIITKQNNVFYRFGSVKEYDLNTNENIFLEDVTEEMVNLVERERNYLIEMFHKNVNCIVDKNKSQVLKVDNVKKNTALIVEPRFLEIIPYIINEYYKILGEDWIIVFYCGKGLKPIWENKLGMIKNIEIRELEVNNLNAQEHSYIFKQQELWENLYGEFVLTFQTDSIIKNIEPYTINNYVKLDKSYIGGNMCYEWKEINRENISVRSFKNFNGGLSLRKRLDMIKIIETFGIEFTEKGSNNIKTDAEDVYFTVGCYKLNLPVGDDEFCSHFAVHSIYHDKFFGVHNSVYLPKNQLIKDHTDLEFFVKNFV